MRWADLDLPEYDEMVARTLAALRDHASGYTQEFHIVRPQGVLWLREAVAIQYLGDDRYRMTGVITDTTAQRQSDAARLASENRLVELLSRAECLLWESNVTLHPDGWKWQHNIQPSLLYLRLSGHSHPSAAEEMWPLERVPERLEMDRRCREALASGLTGYDQTFHYVTEKGDAVWINENVKIHQTGPDAFSLVGVAVDITAARRAEEALAEERERLAVILRAMNEAVITTDTAGCVEFLNPAAIALLELPANGAKGRPAEELCRLESSRTGQPVALPVGRVARTGLVADLPAQTHLVAPSGRRRVVEGRCAPIRAADSKVVGTVLVVRDVTEQDRLEQELVRATRLESVGVLAGGIAHDFNNILTAVMGNLALAQLDVASDSPAGLSLRSAEKAALRARDLTQQLLTFAKGGEPLRAAVQLETVLREVTSFALSGSQVRAHFDLAPNLWPADADKGQIGRVVQNLVLNAVQAMPRGGSLRVVARNDEVGDATLPGLTAGSYIQIAISDTGIGIRPENLSRIFDPYFTTKDTGSGLGLAAVYSIIKKHHGHIDVESQVGQGTTFRLWLPALQQHGSAPESHPPWGQQVRLRGRVLFMDDEEIIRTMATTLMHRLGLEVECAAEGAEAVERYGHQLAAGRRFDLVIMDLTVPGGMGGLEAFGRLRAIDPQVRAVVSSGYSSDPVLANFRQHGFVAMVAKPYEVAEITRVLSELLPPG
jgi:PAS domain S-box-containing protein